MTTKTTSITHNTIKGVSVRSINLAKRKYYFVSDLIKVYGRGFVSKLSSEPLVRRVKDGSSNQERKLVNATDFKNALRNSTSSKPPARKITDVNKKPTTSKFEAEQFFFDFLETDKKQPQSTTASLKDIKIDLNTVRKVDEVEMSIQKGQIIAVVDHYVQLKAIKEGLTDVDLAQNDRAMYRDAYTALYREFDRILKKELAAKGKKLEDYNLGAASRKNRESYLDMLGRQGLLAQMFEVAKQMFGYRLAKNK